MKSVLLAVALVVIPVLARAQTDQQALVDRSTLALQDAMMLNVSQQPRSTLTHARAVVVCPQIFKAGFFFGGAGGDCVMAARAGNGTWSYPAFYTIGSFSFGLQIGVQDSEVIMMVMTNRGLNALLNASFKIGVGGSIAVAVIGGGVQGDTTAAVGADIVAFSIARGAFAGVSLEGSGLDSLTGWDQTYYGQPVDARQIVIDMQGRNPGADPLRDLLTRYGTPAPVATAAYGVGPVYAAPPPAAAPPAYASPPAYAAQPASAPPGYAPPTGGAPINLQSGAPIQQQSLPPPR
jgi:lipid-binding SYLF domain-containing protein